ncbi:LytR/AlgR family response regulator transcription factor [Kordia sp.]|uniref:LytR/AlgR family response regulator transcription factor n=1 Tax=Kordia sp. TaxID=1965332 RepID=UPI003D2BA97F
MYIEAYENYSWLHLRGGTKLLSSKPIGYHEQQLTDDRFIRVHRSYLINLTHLKFYEPKYRLVYLKGEMVLPVSFRRSRKFSQMMCNNRILTKF